MQSTSDTKRLENAITALASTMTQIMTERLRVIAEAQEQKIATKTIEPVWTKEQTAKHLQITNRTLEKWMRRGLIPYYKIGRTVLFRMNAVQRYWDQRFEVGGTFKRY